MKKISIICMVLLLLCAAPVSATTSEDLSVVSGCHTLDGQVPYLGSGQLISNAVSAILYETNTDTLMYAHNADAKVQPSSLLKILTALIAIEKGSMGDAVTVRAEVLDTIPPDAAMVELMVDEVVTVKDLIYCMMVGSGNDAAVVLADHVMGSQQAFVAEMNRYAAELGCIGTNFVNVHGLHNENQYTTARDVARILQQAMENEEFLEVFGAKYYDMPQTNKSEPRHLSTQNYLVNNDKVIIYHDPRVTGGRTAVNNDRTRSIATTAQVDEMKLICVVIGAKSQFEKDGYTEKVFGGYEETKQLLDLGSTGYRTAQIIYPDQVLQQSSVLNGSCDVTVGSRGSVYSVIAENADAESLSFRYVDEIGLTAPIEKGQKLSTLQIWYGGSCIAQTETYAMNSVPVAGSVFSDDTQKGERGVLSVILSILGGAVALALGIFIVLYMMRTYSIVKAKQNSRRHSKNRRRSR